MWGDDPLLIDFGPVIQGGDVFRRDSQDGSPFRYDVAGLWGSGNTITERRLRLLGEGTVYSMWDGHALQGPGRPGAVVERYPALVATIPLSTHLERYADLPGDACLVGGALPLTSAGFRVRAHLPRMSRPIAS